MRLNQTENEHPAIDNEFVHSDQSNLVTHQIENRPIDSEERSLLKTKSVDVVEQDAVEQEQDD